MRADTLGFLAPQAAPPESDPDLHDHINLMHVTVAPPPVKTMDGLLNGFGPMPSIIDFRKTIEKQSNLTIVENRSQLATINTDTTTGIIMGLQESPHDTNTKDLAILYELGVRVITPSYQAIDHPNGAGYLSKEVGLTDKGREFLLGCEAVGMIVDLSHVGHKTATDILDFHNNEQLDVPILASHGGIYEEFVGNPNHKNNKRNLPWETLERIAELRGIIGIYALTFGLVEKSEYKHEFEAFIEIIGKATERLGENNVAIGTDAIYQKWDIDDWKAHIDKLTAMVAASGELESRFPDIPLELNTVDKIGVIENSLVIAGMPEIQREKVLGANAYRFFMRSL